MISLAPIILFTYNRPEHTRITLECLMANELADQSILYIYCDGPKSGSNQEQIDKIQKVKRVIRSVQWTKEVIIIESETNKGLAKNVIEGVTEVVNRHDGAIVIEDDLLLSTGFLRYMNTALDKYKEEEKVEQISGFLFPIGLEKENSSFFLPLTNTIGWGTWKRAWDKIDFTAKGYEKLKTDKALRRKFNLDGAYNYSKMLMNQMKNDNFGSWAILYWWHVFNSGGLVLYPDYALVQHNDFDHSGSHSGADDHYAYDDWDGHYIIDQFPAEVKSNEIVYGLFQKYINKYSRYTINNIYIHFRKILRKTIKL